MKSALIIIDLQNDYFPKGAYPLWNTEDVLAKIKKAIVRANKQDVPVVFIQHVVPKGEVMAPFFNEYTEGVKIYSELLALAPNADVVTKVFADGFHQTHLEEVLSAKGIEKLYICGMMTQNCVTHTAISKQADKYEVSVIPECCTSVDEMIHGFALHALSTRVEFEGVEQIV
jgi:nicotinamidase-related amidase